MVGFIAIETATLPPGCHVYDVAPLAVKVLPTPGQTTEGVAVIDRLGNEFTETCVVALAVQDAALPVTV